MNICVLYVKKLILRNKENKGLKRDVSCVC